MIMKNWQENEEKQKERHTQGHSRGQAIKRIGLLGLGDMLASGLSRISYAGGALQGKDKTQQAARVVPCYHSTVLNYYSIINCGQRPTAWTRSQLEQCPA